MSIICPAGDSALVVSSFPSSSKKAPRLNIRRIEQACFHALPPGVDNAGPYPPIFSLTWLIAIKVALYLRSNPIAVFANRVSAFAIPPICCFSIDSSAICIGTRVAILSKINRPTSPVFNISNAISKISSADCASGRIRIVGTVASSLISYPIFAAHSLSSVPSLSRNTMERGFSGLRFTSAL